MTTGSDAEHGAVEVGRAPELRAGDGGTRLSILHLVARSQWRGAELVALELADELNTLGHDNRVVALGLGQSGALESELPALVPSVGTGPLDLIPRVLKVRKMLAESPVDVILAHGGWAAQVTAFAVPRQGGPLLVWQRIGHFSAEVNARSRRWWWRRVARRFDVGIALTAELEAELRAIGFEGPIWMIPNSRKPDRFVAVDRDVARRRLAEQLGLDGDVLVLASVGHLDRMKRVDRALEVHAELLKLGVPTHLVIVGDGPLRSELEAHAERLGTTRRVSFVGRRSDVEWLLGAADTLLVTSDLEGIPGVAIEAAMVGCPVVSVPVGGIAEVVEHQVTGLVLPDADVNTMATEVAALLGDRARRTAMGSMSRSRSDRFSATHTADTLLRSLRAELAGR